MHCDHDCAGPDRHRLTVDGVLVFHLKVIFHLAGRERVLAEIVAFGDRKDNEESCSECKATYRRN